MSSIPSMRRVPATGQQLAMYFFECMRPPGTLNIARSWRIDRPVRPEWLSSAAHTLVERYDSLSLQFSFENGTLWAVQRPAVGAEVCTEQWADDGGEPLDDWLREAAAYPFSVDSDSALFRVNVRWAPDRAVVCLVAHHLVADWWSMNLLFNSFMAHVQQLSGKTKGTDEPVTAPSFLDYAERIAGHQDRRTEQAALDYWREIFSTRQPLRFRPPRGASIHEPEAIWATKREVTWATSSIGPDAWAGLRARAAAERCTPFALLLTMVFEVMASRSETADFLICVPVFNRTTGDEMHLVGSLANRIYLKAPPADEEFSSRLSFVASQLKQALRFQGFCFDDLIDVWDTRDLTIIHDAMMRVFFGEGSHIAVAQYVNIRSAGSGNRYDDVIPLQEEVGGGMMGDFFFVVRGEGDGVSANLAVNPGVLPGRQAQDMLGELTQRLKEIIGSALQMYRDDFLAAVHRLYNPRSYLEIGVDRGCSLALSRTRSIGVDPGFKITAEQECPLKLVRVTSDEFFARKDALSWFGEETVDLTFIDGLHIFEFGLRDFLNSERLSAPGSLILMDDIFPRSDSEAARARRTREWTGDVYKLVAVLEKYRPDLTVVPVDTFPTGTLMVLDLDPGNTVLSVGYDEIVAEYATPDPQSVPYEVLHRVRAADPRGVLRAPVWGRLAARTDGGAPRGVGEELRPLLGTAQFQWAPPPDTPWPPAQADS